ncbi:D-erythronate dehydrogenase [Roseivivax isoporae]|uniref:NAD-dependent epimerase/dehydratase domain-containing protein n=1 Tax=Roseivivax isoporae LMG 25204 TaxID=1449351 RepID=X7F6V4_9RHOB|nr:D-erythronate dehydrogenase [Roseivivax isoporae]ETX27836.1 hypothetical protein RISW2_10915 [Roseivivax isoporae LMG 25204]
MQVVVTGGAGFLGARLISALLDPSGAEQAGLPGLERIISFDLAPCAVKDHRVLSETGNVTDTGALARLVTPETAAVIHLAAVVSSQAEAEFDLGMSVNLDGTRALLDAARAIGTAPLFFFSSSLAVFGAGCPDIVREDQVLRPQSSYGTQKAIGEMLVTDYTRKGFVRGVSARLPTVTIRPGRPNAAASSFVSSILREPIAGAAAVLPVAPDMPLWVSSPDAVVRNIVALLGHVAAGRAGEAPVNLPGITVTPRQMLEALGKVCGTEAAARVAHHRDPKIEAIVGSWPSSFDVTTAQHLGLSGDRDIVEIIDRHRLAQT